MAGNSSLAVPPAEKLLAPDTVAFVTAPNGEALAAALRRNPYGQLWADPAMDPFRKKFEARFKAEVIQPLEKQLGLSLGSYASLFQGQVTLAWTATSPDGRVDRSSGFLLLADTGAKSLQLSTNLAMLRQSWAAADKPLKPIKIRDQEFWLLVFSLTEMTRTLDKILPNPGAGTAESLPPPSKPVMAEWTIGQVGPLLIVADSAHEVDKVLALLGSNAPPALAGDKRFTSDAALFREAQAYGWVNVKAVLDHLEGGAVPGAAGSASPLLPFGQLLQALGFGGLETAVFSLKESSAGTSMELHLAIPEAARKGLFKMMSLEPKDSFPPPFVSAAAIRFSRARLDLPKMWGSLEATLAEASPPAAVILKAALAVAGKDKDATFDLRERLIAQLGDDLIVCEKAAGSGPNRNGEPSLFLVGARQPESVVKALPALFSLMPPEAIRHKEREYLGHTIHSVTILRAPEGAKSAEASTWHYAAGGSYVALSDDAAMIDDYLGSGEGARRALRDQPGLAEAARRAGGTNTGFFSYENTSESAQALFASAGKNSLNAGAILGAMKLGGRLGLGREGGFLTWVDSSLLPPFERVAKYFYLNVTTLSQNADGLTFKFLAPLPPPLQK